MFAVPSKPWVVGHHLILLHHTLQWESKNVAMPDPSKLIKLAIAECQNGEKMSKVPDQLVTGVWMESL
jgi:hypothetical protein